jgi:hypothetical protein
MRVPHVEFRHMTRLRPSARHRRPLRQKAGIPPALAVLILGIAATACSSKAATTTTSTLAAPTTSTPVTSTSAGPSTTVPSKTSAGIDKAYMTLFDLSSPAIAPKLAAVQDGSVLRGAFKAALGSPLAKEAGGARVLSVTIESAAACSAKSLPSPCALVTYDVLSPAKTPLLTNEKGSAVESGGHWLVSKTTICSLLSLESAGATPPGC